MARERLSDERGFTLSELLVAIMIGGIVITAAVSLVMMSLTSSQRISDKVQGLSDGRLAMVQLQQRLHSVSCLASGEYGVNGVTNYTAANAITYAGPTELVYFADISNGNGATNVAGSVGFLPYLRYLNVDEGATARAAGRRTRLMDGFRVPTTTTSPYMYSLAPYSTPTDLTSMATSAGVIQAPPTSQKPLTELVANAVDSSGAAIPYFQYFDGPTVEVVPSNSVSAPYVAYSRLDEIDHIRVTYRMLADSGRDQAAGTTAANPSDNRTTTFSDDIYMRTSAGDCSAF
jgi:prepilin-type N-terminal cleavage/methylation domain-containing protein